VSDRLPPVAMIDRPEEFLARPPYFLIVRASDRKVVVQGSHQASLELLADYLKKWAKTNRQFHDNVGFDRFQETRLTVGTAAHGGSAAAWLAVRHGHDIRPD
jgi:hypothetical protein